MTHHETILVVDDDHAIVGVIRDYLEGAGYRVFVAYDGETALHVARREQPALMILDLMLPGRDGWSVTRTVRGDRSLRETPIIMLTARVDDTDKIVGLELGADDYITKPFNPREVVARVRTVLRRVGGSGEDRESREQRLRSGKLILNVATREVNIDDRIVRLTPTEFRLLHTLIASPDFVFTRVELVEKAFGYDYDLDDRALDNHIRNLRKKIEPDPNTPTYVQTVYGVGYRLVSDPA